MIHSLRCAIMFVMLVGIAILLQIARDSLGRLQVMCLRYPHEFLRAV